MIAHLFFNHGMPKGGLMLAYDRACALPYRSLLRSNPCNSRQNNGIPVSEFQITKWGSNVSLGMKMRTMKIYEDGVAWYKGSDCRGFITLDLDAWVSWYLGNFNTSDKMSIALNQKLKFYLPVHATSFLGKNLSREFNFVNRRDIQNFERVLRERMIHLGYSFIH